MNKPIIPVNEPYLGQREKDLVNECLESGWISSAGKYIEKFEKEFAAYCECSGGVTTTSGTTAIHLALKSLDVGPRDEVLVPGYTLPTIVNAGTRTSSRGPTSKLFRAR
jgi:perosamine synthetase